ncbi:MAG: hypothetical protein H8D47_03570 [Planctomycetes bacterium]|nr:hypothetical protein [Planctomycetota bacterium]MBL7106761.1 hypothetical protein [Phycisphaerae bacterium]
MRTKNRIDVLKSDFTSEPYMHTKVIGTISKAIDHENKLDIHLAQNLAEVVTYYIYNSCQNNKVSSSQIFSVIKATLTSAEHQKAAEKLENHYWRRKLKRSRTTVACLKLSNFSDARTLFDTQNDIKKSPWQKSIIINDLVCKHKFDIQTARTIASMVEEKIFRMDMPTVPKSLVSQLVWADAAMIENARMSFQKA